MAQAPMFAVSAAKNLTQHLKIGQPALKTVLKLPEK
jgi:hypothetical protein